VKFSSVMNNLAGTNKKLSLKPIVRLAEIPMRLPSLPNAVGYLRDGRMMPLSSAHLLKFMYFYSLASRSVTSQLISSYSGLSFVLIFSRKS